jgi:uncharacterized protein (TIGR03067 family)
MRPCVRILLGLIVVGLMASRESKADDAKNELEGTWVMVSVERDGREIRPQTNLKMIYTGDKFVLKAGDDVVVAGTVKLDTTKKPKAVDTTYTEGPNTGQTLKGIYEVDGDTAKFCRAGAPDQDRPTEFKTKAGSGGLFSVYKRAKP